MEHIIDELLEMMDDKIEEEYSNMNSIVFYNDYKRGIEMIRERLEEFDGLVAEINQLEAKNGHNSTPLYHTIQHLLYTILHPQPTTSKEFLQVEVEFLILLTLAQ